MRKRGSEKSEKGKEECLRHKNGLEEGGNDEWKFDQESTLVTRVEEFQTHATRPKTRQSVHPNGLWCGGEIRGGSGSVTDQHCACCHQRSVEETDGEEWKEREMRKCNESTLHVVLHLPNTATAAAPAAAAAKCM